MFQKNLIHDVRLIRSIEPDRGSPKFLKQISIDPTEKKHIFRKNNLIFVNTPQSIEDKK